MGFGYGKPYYRWIVLLCCMFIYSTSQLVRWNYASITKYLSADLNIGKPELGLLGSAFFYAYAIAQMPWGTATDMFGGRKVMPIGIAFLSIFLGMFAFTTTFTQAVISRTLMGFCAAAAFVPITSVLSKWFSKKERGLAMEMYAGPGGGLGECLTFLAIPVIALIMKDGGIFGMTGWRGSTLVMALIVLAISIFAAIFLKSSPTDMGLPSVEQAEDKKDDTKYLTKALAIMKDPVLWVMSISWSGYMIAARLFAGWISLYAADFYIQTKGMSKEQAMIAGGVMASIFVGGRVVGTPFVGKLSDYLLKKYQTPRSVVVFWGMVGVAVMFGIFTTPIPNPIVLGTLCFIAGVLWNIYPLMNASAAEIWSIKTAGFSMGIINTIGQLGGALALSASGFMAVKFSIKGGAFYTEFLGIWYLGIGTSVVAALAGLYIVYREKQAIKEHLAAARENEKN